jgi:hypothetical protein
MGGVKTWGIHGYTPEVAKGVVWNGLLVLGGKRVVWTGATAETKVEAPAATKAEEKPESKVETKPAGEVAPKVPPEGKNVVGERLKTVRGARRN